MPDETSTDADPRPAVFIDADEHRVVRESIKHLHSDWKLFQREGQLVRTVRLGTGNAAVGKGRNGVSRNVGALTIAPLPAANLRERLAANIFFSKANAKGKTVHAHPTDWLVQQILDRKDWPGIRHLKSVSDAPVLRSNGSIFQKRGYDAKTCVVYDPPPRLACPPIPSNPTLDDAKSALSRLKDIVCDFRFEAPEHFSAWLAALLTPLARFTFDGPTPCFLIDANIRGAGKTMLAQVIGQIVQGRDLPVAAYAHEAVELEKIITGVAIAGDRIILLDNITGPFGNAVMDRLLTHDRWKGRKLGVNENPEFPMVTVWLATGNNVALSGDICRRTIHIRLNVEDEHPEYRNNFAHPSLIQWVINNRGQFLTDALTILSGFLRSGATVKPATAFGSYEGWSRVIRSAILWLELPDPCLTQVGLADSSDNDTDTLAQLLSAWEGYSAHDPYNQGTLIPTMLQHLYGGTKDSWPSQPSDVAMRSALEAIVHAKVGHPPTAKQIGNRLKAFKGRYFGGRCLNRVGERTNQGYAWSLIGKTQTPDSVANNGGSRASGASGVCPLSTPREKTQGNCNEATILAGMSETDTPDTQDALFVNTNEGYQGEPEEMSIG